jgi:hypothetical protein
MRGRSTGALARSARSPAAARSGASTSEARGRGATRLRTRTGTGSDAFAPLVAAAAPGAEPGFRPPTRSDCDGGAMRSEICAAIVKPALTALRIGRPTSRRRTRPGVAPLRSGAGPMGSIGERSFATARVTPRVGGLPCEYGRFLRRPARRCPSVAAARSKQDGDACSRKSGPRSVCVHSHPGGPTLLLRFRARNAEGSSMASASRRASLARLAVRWRGHATGDSAGDSAHRRRIDMAHRIPPHWMGVRSQPFGHSFVRRVAACGRDRGERVVPDGTDGDLVFTGLENQLMPLIGFEGRDVVC